MKRLVATLALTAAIAVAAIVLESRPSAATVVDAAPIVRVASETRCGWFANPTPANAWLNDADGEWIIAVQGGFQAEGDWPDFKPSQWIETNVHYGYGCACMKATTDKAAMHVVNILKAWPRPLSACRKDKALKRIEPKD
jgi:hypothetical protein